MIRRYLTRRDVERMTPGAERRLVAYHRAIVRKLEADHRDRYPNALKPYCEVPGCIRHSRAHGMCDTHYRQELRAIRRRDAA